MATALTVENGRQLQQIASDLLVQAEAAAVLLTDIGGNVLAQAPAREDAEIQTAAALAAASFSATRELAAMTGERSFHAICHEGEATSIYVTSLEGDFLLLVIFQRVTTLGLVKLYAKKAAKDMRPVLEAVSRQPVATAHSVRFEMHDRPAFAPARGPQAAETSTRAG